MKTNLKISRGALAALAITLTLAASAWAQTETNLFEFNGTSTGNDPYAGVIADSAGNLYGTTISGGANGDGTVFELSLVRGSWVETVLFSFSGTNGETPYSALVFDAEGNLYGTTENGGASGDGVVFKLSPGASGWTETVIHNFNGTDGSQPRGTLIFDSAGNLYGTTFWGAINACPPWTGCGTVFELTPTESGTWKETLVHRFTGETDGGNPVAGLTMDAAGNLYGTTEFGGFHENACASFACGVAFKLAPAGPGKWKESVLHSFDGKDDGELPIGGVTLDASGNLYGTAEFGGAYGYGVAFKLSQSGSSWEETVLHAFNEASGSDGGKPWAGVSFDASGNLYGTTYDGGLYDGGVVYKLAPGAGSWTESIVYNFPGFFWIPTSPVLVGSNGTLYGTTGEGGNAEYCDGNGCGIVYQITQ